MDDLQILVKAILDDSSSSSLDTQLTSLVKSLSKTHEIELKVILDQKSVSTAQTQLQAIARQASSATRSNSGAGLKVFDSAQLQADGQRYFLSVKDIISRAQKEFGKLGSVDITNIFKNAKGDIQSFTASIIKADGVVEKLNFDLAMVGDKLAYVQRNSISSDKSAGTELNKTLNFLNRINTRIANLTSKTLTSSARPLLEGTEQFDQYQARLEQVQNRIGEITASTETLSEAHKREINTMVNDLQLYAKELQAIAYVATDLKAAAVPVKKEELVATLETNIKKWSNAGIFDGDFKAKVLEAKSVLEQAMNPSDLDAYRHMMHLISEDFKQMKLDAAQVNASLNSDTLTTNIFNAQLRIQNLKETYSAFTNDPKLMGQWQKLFDASQLVTSQKELTNLNAKIRLFEQNLIRTGKHRHSMSDELKNNIGKMANWMVLGGVIAAIMRGVTGLYGAVVDLDTAMVELKKVTDETSASYDRFLSNAAQKSVEIGTAYTDFVKSTADFARLCYSIEDATKLSEVANIYNVVGDGLSGIDQATEYIIGTMKAFGIEAENAISIVDRLNNVSNNYALSAGDLGVGLSNSASSLATAGNSLDEAIAMIAAMTEITQDASESGNALKILSMRLRGASTEIQDAGESTDGMAESSSKLREEILALTNVTGKGGFDIMLDEDYRLVLDKLA